MIFFDLDGTLLDHKYSDLLGVKAFYKENKQHFPIDEDEFYQLWRNLSDKYFKRYLNGEFTFAEQRRERVREVFASTGILLSDNDAEKKFQTYLISYQNNWKPFHDVVPCLTRFNDYRFGIISNGDYQQQLFKLEKMGIQKYFDVIVAASDVGVAKPNAEIFRTACNKVNKHPKDCFYIGDDLNIDILPCVEVGMTGIWLNRTSIDEPHISTIKMIHGLDELERFL